MAIKEETQSTGRSFTKESYARSHVGFAWLRVSCGLIVIFSHSFWLLDPMHPPLLLGVGVGEYALLAVFAMSGYQILDSWERDPSWWRFSARRLLRILPPLAVVLTITVFVIGPLFTTLSLGAYFGAGLTWHYLSNVIPFWLQGPLPGTFADNPHHESVNPSLWTLPMELLGYGCILVLGLAIAFGLHKLLFPLLLAGLLVTQGVYDATLGAFDSGGQIGVTPMVFLVKFLIAFTAGAVLHAYRHKISLRPLYAVVLAATWLLIHVVFMSDSAGIPGPAASGDDSIFRLVTLDKWLMTLALSYGVIVLGTHWPKRLESGAKWVYGSYGLYLWGAPLQQTFIALGITNGWVLLIVSAPAAYLFGQLSWRLVETPTQKWRRYLKARQLQ